MEYKTVGSIKIPQNLSFEKQAIVDEIARNYAVKNREINKDNFKNMGRIALGSILSGASFHPILNIPYVGTGLGGAMYDAGQGIVEGDSLGDIAKRAGRGFAIGETVGAVPYVGKGINKLSGGKIENAVDAVAEKVAANPAVQKAYDALMTDVKAFKPNKQIAYHGSPYDFEKFSNEAIGTGEGAQAHGYGHYVALDRDVAGGYRNRLTTTTAEENLIKQYGKERVINDLQNNLNDSLQELQALQKAKLEQAKVKDFGRRKPIDYDNSIKLVEEEINNLHKRIYNINNPQISGQLYKLSVPKDDVMLREGAKLDEQPLFVQRGLKGIENNLLKEKGVSSADDLNNQLDKLSQQYENIVRNENPWDFGSSSEKSLIQSKISDLENLKRLYDSPDIYEYLKNHAKYSPEELSNLLYKKGIKGISYNGGIDGEARVIFNPNDIDIVRKFYNQPEAIDYLNKMKPNSGAVADAFNDYITKEEQKQWKQYAKDNLIGNSVDVPNYTTVNFTNKNLGKDYVYNLPEYTNLLDNLKNSKYQFSTNYKNETDRLYDHLTKEDKNRLFDYLIEVIKDNEGNIHHNYKMMKNISRGDLP